jgi:heme/copper-type cytochrome/quinol oxidase subunit 2
MPIEVRALPEAEYKAWLDTAREEFAMNTSVPQVAPDAVAEDKILLASAN